MELRTERLFLREFTSEDWPAVLAYQSDPLYLRYNTLTERTAEAVQAFIQLFMEAQEQKPRTKYQLAIILPETGQLIGIASMRMAQAEATTGEIGYELAAAYWGRGYATEVAKALLKFGFTTLDLHRIEASCNAENTGSARVMEKIGMRREAHFRERAWFKGRWWDEYIYAILKPEWATPE